MRVLKHIYLIHIQFLGFRFHGWQKQTNIKTVEGTIDTVMCKIFANDKVKLFGGSRTDAMVSANHYAFQFIKEETEIESIESFIENANYMLPSDIKILSVQKIERKFNIIQSPKLKEYHYYFSFGFDKPHPFSAPLLSHIRGNMDLELMKKGASLFVGTHDFKKYCYKPHPDKVFVKTIDHFSIELNENYKASFFPEKTYYFKVIGHSFMRHQIRLMAGTLFMLGLGEITLEEFESSLLGLDFDLIGFVAPAAGLILHEISFDLEKPEY